MYYMRTTRQTPLRTKYISKHALHREHLNSNNQSMEYNEQHRFGEFINLKVTAPLKWRLYADIQSSGSSSHL